jgi:hypothetical protein
MGRTRRDLHQGTVLRVVKRDDGNYDLYLNSYLDRGGIHTDGLLQEICVRFGYCGEEFEDFQKELETNREATRRF